MSQPYNGQVTEYGIAHVEPNGAIWYSPNPDADPSWPGGLDPSKFDVKPNGQGGYTAVKKNALYDVGIPVAIGSLFAYGAFGPGGYAGLGGGGGASGASGAASGVDLSTAPAVGSTAAGVIPGVTLGANGVNGLPLASSFGSSLASFLKNQANIAKLIATIPAARTLFGGSGSGGVNGNSPFSADSPLMQSAQHSLDLGNKRMDEVQPVYDTLVNMAYGMSPKQYRGAAPAGYPGDQAPQGAYAYQPPRFG